MKRCPECDFLYEDDQMYCDMEGKTLVFASDQFGADDASDLIRIHNGSRRRQAWFLVVPIMIVGISLPVISNYQQRNAGSSAASSSTVLSPDSIPSAAAGHATSGLGNSASPETVNSASPPNSPIEKQSSPSPVSTDTSPEKLSTQRSSRAPVNAGDSKDAHAVLVRGGARSLGANRAKTGGIQIVEVKPGRSNSARLQPVRTSSHIQEVSKSKDSKITQFLKKTGHILAKPF